MYTPEVVKALQVVQQKVDNEMEKTKHELEQVWNFLQEVVYDLAP